MANCINSDTLAATLLTMDEGVAREFIEQIGSMNALSKIWDTAVLNVAQAQLDWKLAATILKMWEGWEVAKKKLVEQMAKSSLGTSKGITDLLNKLDNFSKNLNDPKNAKKLQSLYNVMWYSKEVGQKKLNDALDSFKTYMGNEYALKETYWVLDELSKDIKIDKKSIQAKKLEYDKETKRIIKEAEDNLINDTYNNLFEKWLVDDDNCEFFITKIDKTIQSLNDEKRDIIRKLKLKAWQKNNDILKIENKIERYNKLKWKIQESDVYKEAKKKRELYGTFWEQPFYSPVSIKNGRKIWDLANKETDNDVWEVSKARAQFIILAHKPWYIESLWLNKDEAIKIMQEWTWYPQEAYDLSKSINEGISPEYMWTWLENSSILNSAQITKTDLSKMLNGMKWEYTRDQIENIAGTMFALDWYINWWNLKFKNYKKWWVHKETITKWDYNRWDRTIRIWKKWEDQNTVAHEMWHYLDNQFCEDLFWNSDMYATEIWLIARWQEKKLYDEKINIYRKLWYGEERSKVYAEAFVNKVKKIYEQNKWNKGMDFVVRLSEFIDSLRWKIKQDDEWRKKNFWYLNEDAEIFARFVAEFTERTRNKATDKNYAYELWYYHDNFEESDFIAFTKFLQEKSVFDYNWWNIEKIRQRNKINSNRWLRDAEAYAEDMFDYDFDNTVKKFDVNLEERTIRISQLLKEKKDIPNTDATYIAMRTVLGDEQAYNNYVVARVLLSEWDEVVENILRNVGVAKLFGNELTQQTIDSISSLEDLVSVAFSYTSDLKKNDELLKSFLKKKEMLVWDIDTEEKLWVVSALNNIQYYWDDFNVRIKYDIFANNLIKMWYELPKGVSNKKIYTDIADKIINNVKVKVIDWKPHLAAWEWLTIKWSDWKKVVISWDDLRRLLPSFLPSSAPFVNFKDVISVAWYDDYLNKLESAVKKEKPKGVLEWYDDIAESLYWKSELIVDDTDNLVFDTEKINAIADMYEKMVKDPSVEDRDAIFIRAITGQTIDPKKSILLKSSYDNASDVKENQVKADLYSWLAKTNSIPVASWIKDYTPQQASNAFVSEETASLIDYVIIEWGSIDNEMYSFINQVDAIRDKKWLDPVTIVRNRMYNKGRFYVEDGNLRYSIIATEDFQTFIEKILEMKLNYWDDAVADMPALYKMYADYVDAVYGWDSPNAQLSKIEKLLWVPVKFDKWWNLVLWEWDEIEYDVYKLDQYIQQVLNTTGKFKVWVVDLAEKWEVIDWLWEWGLITIANHFADEIGLEWIKDIQGIDIERAKELLFASLYNKDIKKAIQSKYAFLKLFWITWVAKEIDKVTTINYLLNKQLKLWGFNMWVLQSDEFVMKLINNESLEWDLWSEYFINANSWNPSFLAIDWKELEDKFNTLINNIKENIQFEDLKQQLSFPDKSWVEGVEYMPHEWEEAVYKMLTDPNTWISDWLIGSLNSMWLYLWQKNTIKNSTTKDMSMVLDLIKEYKERMINIAEQWWKYADAIELKQELQFVLSTINNKMIIPHYVWIVPDSMIQDIALAWTVGIPLNISNTENAMQKFVKDVEDIEKTYLSMSKRIKNSRDDINKMTAEERGQKAKETWKVTIIDKEGELRELSVEEVIRTYRDNIKRTWLIFADDANNMLSLTNEEISKLSVRQQYDVFKKMSILNKYSQYYEIYKQVYYRMHTLLATSNFFENYKLASNWYPKLFWWVRARYVTDANISDQDLQHLMENIYDNLMATSFTEWVSLVWSEALKFGSNYQAPSIEIIRNVIDNTITSYWFEWLTEKQINNIQKYMESIFNPYSELQSLPQGADGIVQKMLHSELLDPLATSLWFTKEQAIAEMWDTIIWSAENWSTTVSELFTMKDSQMVFPDYIRNGNNQKVTISRLNGGNDVDEINKELNSVKEQVAAVVNWFEVITDLDKAVAKDTWRWVSWLFRSNTLLNQIARAEDLLFNEGNEISALLKDVVFNKTFFWFKQRWLAEIFPHLGWWQLRKAFLEDEWNAIKLAYNRYYNMSLWELEKVDLNDVKDSIEGVWLRLALYFKKLWDMLWSSDWLIGVTTDAAINRALYNIGDCINYVDSSNWVLSLSSWLNGFQILKFTKVIKKWSEGYNEFLHKISQASAGKARKWEEIADPTTRALVGTWLEKSDINRFNELFNSDFDVKDAQRIVFALWWFQRDNRWNRTVWQILQRASKSSLLTRMFSSYPYWLLPVPLQQIAYEIKKDWMTKKLWLSSADLNVFHNLRKRDNVLVWWYFEVTDALSPKVKEEIEAEIIKRFWWVEEFMNSVAKQYSDLWDLGIIDSLSPFTWILKWDSYETIYSKLKRVFNNPEARKLLDNTKENANNIIDWLNSSAIKDLCFAQAVMRNRVYKFYSPEDYYMFMRDPNISNEFKKKVKDEITIMANRSFIDTMWLGGGATRAVVAYNWFGDALLQLHNFINFRWQWGTTILRNFTARMKQIFWVAWYAIKNAGKQWLADEIVEWFMRTPEMQNLMTDIFNTAYWAMHAQRSATRGYDEDESEETPLSFFDRYNTISWLAMFLQWLSSWGRGRILSSWFEWFMYWLGRDTISFWDSLWIAWVEMVESFFQNFGRQFKFEKFVSDFLMVSAEQVGNDDFDAYEYFWEQLRKLSQGSLRYMANENGYDNYSNIWNRVWANRLVAWSNVNKENILLSHNEAYWTWLKLTEAPKRWWSKEDNGIDMIWVITDMASQWTMFKVAENIKNTGKALYYQMEGSLESKEALSKMSKNVADVQDFATAVEDTEEGREFRDKGWYTPQDTQWYVDLHKRFVKYNYVWWAWAAARIIDVANGVEIKYMYGEEALFYEKIGKDWLNRLAKVIQDADLNKELDAMGKRKTLLLAAYDELAKLQNDPLYPELAAYVKKGADAYRYDLFVKQKYNEYKNDINAWITKKKDYKNETQSHWEQANKYALMQEFVDMNNYDWAKEDTTTYKSLMFNEMVRRDESGKFKSFVESSKGKDDEGNDVLEYKIKSKYRTNYDLTQKALKEFRDWNGDDAIATMSLIIKNLDYDDPTGVVWMLQMKDILQYIDELPWFDQAEKASMKFKLFNENYNTVKKVADKKDIFWDDSYIINLVSEMRYDVDQSLVQAMQEVAQSYEAWNEDKKSWRIASLKASKIKLDNLSWWDRGSRGNWWSRWKPTFNYSIPELHWSEYLRNINQRKNKKSSMKDIDTSIGTYKEIPLVTQPKDLWKPKKIKGEKKKVKNTTKK